RHFNNKMNLTSILEPDLIYIKHFYDSLLVSSLVRFDQINSLGIFIINKTHLFNQRMVFGLHE
ncbi:MAG: hypothetical protein Q8883_02595, partial [Sweet potato little leaf phytoplasma]|nr:hypothetical protein [Sweet potato little leaf phytoplasma]